MDRLSALPDGVICHILSFLPTQSSVQTSVLAKRWSTRWAHVPVISFDHREFSLSRRKSFPGMVCAFMLRHKVGRSLNTFRLVFDGDDGPFCELKTCISTAFERNVQNLHLAFRVNAPRCLLTCKTLVGLTLCKDVSIPPTAHISLPNLKVLNLWHLTCKVDFARLLSGCPVLEELIIVRTTCRDARGCCISSPTLKRLTFVYLLDISMLNHPGYMVTINTPELRFLKVLDRSSKHIYLSPCTFLVEADIFIHSLCEHNDFYRRCVLMLLNVKCLKLTGSCDKIRNRRMLRSIEKFGNLTKLELCAPWCFLTKFLETAHHLQVLTIIEGTHSKHWMEPRRACLLNSLRIVIVNGFRCKEQGFNMIRYVLRNALVLERMEINCSCEDDVVKEKFHAIRKVTLFPRESKKCELYFS